MCWIIIIGRMGKIFLLPGFWYNKKNGELDFVCCVIKTGAVWCANSASPLLPFLDTLNWRSDSSTCFGWIVYMCVSVVFFSLYSSLVSTPYWVCVCVVFIAFAAV
jgi:hypothetical protein